MRGGGPLAALRRLPILTTAALVLTAGAPAAPGGLQLRDCVVQGVHARCGTLSVPENRARPHGRHIGLRVVVVPSREQPARADAFTFLAGGPGGAATDATVLALGSWSGIHRRHDIVLVDQRGIGGSHPLDCPASRTPISTAAELRAYVDACRRELGADWRQYGTRMAADDLEDVRVALGYGSLDVYGSSYGATLAQVYLSRYPRSVRTVVLDGGTLLGIPFFSRFAVNGERALDRISARCRAEPSCSRAFPRWRDQLTSLLREWNDKPATVPGAGKVNGVGLAGVVHGMSLSAESAARIPLLVSRTAAGDYSVLADRLRETAGGGDGNVMFWSIWCSEPWVGLSSNGPWNTYLDDYLKVELANYRASCAAIPKRAEPPAAWRTPRSSVPLFALVGGADPEDPVGNLAGLRKAMPASRVVVVPDLGHAIGEYGCLGDLVSRFVERGSAGGLDTGCVRSITAPAFALR